MRKFLMMIVALAIGTAASGQTADKLYREGKTNYDAKNFTAAVPKLKAAAEKGHKKAQYRLGRCYDKGYGVAENNTLAFEWYQKSAAQDYAKAQYALSRCYLKGKGVAVDEAMAKKWITKAVKDEDHGTEILAKIREKAKGGDAYAKTMLKLVNK